MNDSIRTLLLIPTEEGVGLTTTVLGLAKALSMQGVRVCTFSAIYDEDNLHHQVPNLQDVPTFVGVSLERVRKLFSKGQLDVVPEEVIAQVEPLKSKFDVIVMQGVMRQQARIFATRLNAMLFRALGAQVVLVSTPSGAGEFDLKQQLDIAARPFGGILSDTVLGCILNKVHMIEDTGPRGVAWKAKRMVKRLRFSSGVPDLGEEVRVIAQIPWNEDLTLQRSMDVADFLKADVLAQGEAKHRRVAQMVLGVGRLEQVIEELSARTLLITSADRCDLILAVCLSALAENCPELAGMLLTDFNLIDDTVKKYIELAGRRGLPVFAVEDSSLNVSQQLFTMDQNIPADDVERVELMGSFIGQSIDEAWLKSWIATEAETYLTSVSFRYQLMERAKRANKTIVLPEGLEPRTLKAASYCAQAGIANIVLLGCPDNIKEKAQSMGLVLGDRVRMIDPEAVSEQYIKPLIELRAHKGLNEPMAKAQLQDPVMVGTLMLQQGEVDGLVSGAEHTTANTIRPALQIIKTGAGVKLVSSVFFMCMPDQVLVFGDCAVNPEPNAEELADIAISSADSAKAFGVPVRVALISYSTGQSGQGSDVDKVTRANQIVQQKRPDILIDGPLQYDAALIPEVAKSKAPDSPVAGKATVFVFPDLNTGNTTYKAVQRSADVLSIGPMLQGLAKPVNDLSRGATVDDIIYTIALTAIQSAE